MQNDRGIMKQIIRGIMKQIITIQISLFLLCGFTFFSQANNKIFKPRFITLLQTNVENITNIDAIVNPANRWLNHGGGVAGALLKAAGQKLQEESNQILKTFPCQILPVSSVVTTESYNLQKQGIKKIMHAVGPDCRDSEENCNRKELLKKTYENIFSTAKKEGLKSIAIPSISTGIFGYPDFNEATEMALSCIAHAFNNGLDIIIYAHDKQTINRYHDAILKTNLPFVVVLKKNHESK